MTSDQKQDVLRCLKDGDLEGAVETVFHFHPLGKISLTRDEAVDVVEEIERRHASVVRQTELDDIVRRATESKR
jgi:hypothetical protein